MANVELKQNGIMVYIENNSKIDPLLCTPDEINIFFSEITDIGFLLDIAHVDKMEELEKIINAKYPDLLHIADRKYCEVHEHLPIGDGDINYEYIFANLLKEFDGKVIFEVLDDTAIIDAKNKIKNFKRNRLKQA